GLAPGDASAAHALDQEQRLARARALPEDLCPRVPRRRHGGIVSGWPAVWPAGRTSTELRPIHKFPVNPECGGGSSAQTRLGACHPAAHSRKGAYVRVKRMFCALLAAFVLLATVAMPVAAAVKLPVSTAANKAFAYAKHTCAHDVHCVK